MSDLDDAIREIQRDHDRAVEAYADLLIAAVHEFANGLPLSRAADVMPPPPNDRVPREALSNLLYTGRVRLTSDRTLRPPEARP